MQEGVPAQGSGMRDKLQGMAGICRRTEQGIRGESGGAVEFGDHDSKTEGHAAETVVSEERKESMNLLKGYKIGVAICGVLLAICCVILIFC